MSVAVWLFGFGILFVVMAISPKEHRRVPISNAFVYLVLGLLLSPLCFNLIDFDLEANSKAVEMITKLAVILSLLIDGLKMTTPFSDKAWRLPIILGGPVMILSIFAVAALGHFVLNLSWGVGILLGAILAPTDPVLASAVSLRNAEDEHDARFSLTGEAGFNDGAAFPFVILGLDLLKAPDSYSWLGIWFAHRVVWAIPVGLLIGYLIGYQLSLWGIRVRERWEHKCAPNDFLALGLVILAYAIAELLGGWGFLAAFACGIGMRRAVQKISNGNDTPEQDKDTASDSATKTAGQVVDDVFRFGNTAERLLEFAIIFLIGIVLQQHWTWNSFWIAIPLFFFIRPAAVLCAPISVSRSHRTLISWFGIKGIGSIYYLTYALEYSPLPEQSDLVSLILSTVSLSILFHTLTVNPTVLGLVKKMETDT